MSRDPEVTSGAGEGGETPSPADGGVVKGGMEDDQATHRVSFFAEDGNAGAENYPSEPEAIAAFEEKLRDPNAGLVFLWKRDLEPDGAPGKWEAVKLLAADDC